MTQLQVGTKVEKEHKPTYDWIIKEFGSGRVPKAEELYKHIAMDHLKENKKYYKFLAAMEELMEELM